MLDTPCHYKRSQPLCARCFCPLPWQLRERKGVWGTRVCGQIVMSAQHSSSQPGSSDDIPLVDGLVLSRPVFPARPVLMPAFVSPLKDAVSAATDEERLIKIHDVIQQLPPPHYRLGPSHSLPSAPTPLIPRH